MNENDLYKEVKYRKESEIDKAFDYINKLDNEIKMPEYNLSEEKTNYEIKEEQASFDFKTVSQNL